MSMKQTLFPLVASSFSYSGFNKLLTPKYGGQGTILMMHGVHQDQDKPVNKAGMISVSYLEAILKKIHHLGLIPARLHELPELLNKNHKGRFVCLTFDDGYKNNLELAVALLEKYRIPATIFITTGGMDGTLDYEWGGLEQYLANSDEIKIGAYKLPAKSLEEKRRAYQKISSAALADYELWKPEFSGFFKENGVDILALVRQGFLDREGVKALSASPMIDIGGHTLSHPMLTKLSEDQAFQEIQKNKQDLEQLLEHEVPTFAYPYGGYPACGEREFKLAKEAGYKVAVTTRAGSIHKKHKDHALALPRFAVNGLYETAPMLDMYFSGSMRALRSRFGSPFVL